MIWLAVFLAFTHVVMLSAFGFYVIHCAAKNES